MMAARRSKAKLGLVLSGGGARGAFQVGVYERLLRDPRFERGPAVLSGTSAGAINAAMIAAGKSPASTRAWLRQRQVFASSGASSRARPSASTASP